MHDFSCENDEKYNLAVLKHHKKIPLKSLQHIALKFELYQIYVNYTLQKTNHPVSSSNNFNPFIFFN